MSSRTVAVVLKAQIDNYRDQMRQAERHTRDVERAAMSATQRFREHNAALTSMGRGFLVAGAAAEAAVVLVAKATAEYGAKMAQLRSLSGATRTQMDQLSDAAMRQGQAFGQSATQVADAEIELVKAGRSAAQIMGGDLRGALALAAAGQIDVGKATQIGVTALTQFADKGATIPHVADLLAAGADKALGSVEDLGMALNQGGLVASQMGVSLDETTGTLAAFAQNGLLGSDAGTSFKTMLLALQSPSQQAADQLAKYNIHAYDTQGNFVGMAKLAGQLKAGFANASDAERDFALSTIFGSDAIRSANVLYQEGASGIRGWTRDVNAQGFAAAQAAGKMDSLQGDLTKLGAAFDTTLIKAGTSADGGFRGIVQGATNVLRVLQGIPGPVQGAAVGVTALGGAVALAGGLALVAVPKVAAFRAELTRLNVTGRQAAGWAGKAGGLAAGLLAIGTAFASAGERASAGQKEVTDAFNRMNTGRGFRGISDASFRGDAMSGFSGFRDAVSKMGGWEQSVTHAVSGITKMVGVDLASGFEKVERQLNGFGQALAQTADEDLPRATRGFSDLVKRAGGGREAVKRLADAMPDYRDKIVQLLTAQKIAATEQNVLNAMQGRGAAGAKILAAAQEGAKLSAEKQAEGLATLAGKARGATTDTKSLEDAIAGFGSAQLDARGATRAMEQAIDDARKKIAGSKKTLDDQTQAGRDNNEALDAIAQSTAAAASKTLALTGSTEAARKKMREGRAAFIDIAESITGSRKAAEKLADKLELIPANVQAAVSVTGADDAIGRAERLKSYIQWLRSNGVVNVAVRTDEAVNQRLGRAAGGPIDGSGMKGVDSVPALLAPGEHVWTDKEVDAAGGHGAMYRMRAAVLAGVQRFADGGEVSARPSASITLDRRRGFGGLVDQERKRDEAIRDMARLLAEYGREGRALRAANVREARAQRAYDAIDGTKANRGAKRAAKARLDAAKRSVTRAEKAREDTKREYDDAKQARDDARAARLQIAQGREDFVSAERRDPNRRASDPLAYVDQLRQMSRDLDFSPTRRRAMDKAANDSEAALVRLTKAGEAASQKLTDLKDRSAQLSDATASAIRGGFAASGVPLTGARDATTRNVASGWITRGGIRMRTYATEQVAADPGKVTAGGLASYYTAGATKALRFANGLAQLAKKGLNPQLLSEIAGYGTEQGQPIVDALLSANASQLSQVNQGYASIGASASQAGGTVADANFKAQIDAADKNARDTQAAITAEGEKLRALIARAFGLKGYASGTSAADPGIRWVGEDGPELVGFRGGERVLDASASARWVRGPAGGGGPGGGQPVVVQVPPFPDTITVADASGFRATMRVVATQVVDQRHGEMSIRLMGAPA